ncbi:MAG: NUDIX hydrolase [Rhodothermales bacterium]|nr:NUDIX hydrolase [Rhodothermales bacterium]
MSTSNNQTHIRVLVISVFRDGRRILVARGYDEAKSEYFLRPIGGEVEFGESAVEALKREVKEELGLEIESPVRLGILENLFSYDGKPGHEVVFVYDARFTDPSAYFREELPLNEDIWDGMARWVSLDALPAEPLYPDGLLELLGEN